MKTDLYLTLCIAQLALDGNSAATIEFFSKIMPRLMTGSGINGVSAAELTFMTPQGANKHIKNLTNRQYLTRKNKRRWELSDRILKHPSLIYFSRHLYSDN